MAIKQERGTTGLNVYNGIMSEEFLRELRGKEAYKRYDEMRRNSPVVGAMLLYFEHAIRKVSMSFSSDVENDPRVEFLEEAREGMSQAWGDAVSEWLTFVWAGFSLSYPVYKTDARNRWVWDVFSPRKQNTVYQWLFNTPGSPLYDKTKRNGEILGFIQQAPPTYEMTTILSDEIIHFRTRVEANNPEGISLLRNAWIPYYYTKNLQGIEGISFERDGAGLPLIMLPQGANTNLEDAASDINKALETVRNIRVDEQSGVVIPFGWSFSLQSASGKSFADIGKAIERYESRTLMAMLAQFLTLGQNGVGTQALSRDQSNITEMVVNSIADIICETFTKQEIPRILKLNGFDPEGVCLEHTPAGDTDVAMIADFIQKVGDRLTWDASDELWLRQTAGLPEKDEEAITAEMEEKKQTAALVREAMTRAKPSPQVTQSDGEDTGEVDENRTVYGIGQPLDKYKRDKQEREFKAAMVKVLEKQQRRVMKWAREQRNAGTI